MTAIDVAQLKQAPYNEYLIIDTRQPEVFVDGFIKGSFSIPFNADFITNLQDLIPEELKFILVADATQVATITKLLRATGITGMQAYLNGGFEKWQEEGSPFDMLILIDADEFSIDYRFDEFFLLDVRTAEQYKAGHLEDSENIELVELERTLTELDTEDSFYVYGNGIQQAVTAASIFKHYDFELVRPVAATLDELREAGLPVEAPKKKDADNKKN